MGRRKRILIVDDDDHIRFIIGGALKKLGDEYQITTASDGRTALDKARESYYDLLITDLRLPRSDGLALTAALATVSPETRVIWMTAYGCHRFSDEGKRLDVCTCLDKPIEIQDIRQAALSALTDEDKDESNTVIASNA